MFEFADSSSKDLYRYIHNAMCEYVLFLSVTILLFGKKPDSSYFNANVVKIRETANVSSYTFQRNKKEGSKKHETIGF